ncbi:hypothetical protein MMB17_05770 [Methylobacterium organophilum]|uniref:hypothetical protein n=1 Tax=Methylobacterium organophilum TaxID=410 RepID=UPI001F140253|nr:hypothetical protein [Methylobacterium organophilum]UMY18822.1 hypothetical protein MMB17_05770 [Methylobacterium organophilum]
MPTRYEIADAVFAALTDRDKQHLAEAVAAAALSEDGDCRDTFYINLSNAGVPTPGRVGEPVTEDDLRLACLYLADAKADHTTEDVDWFCLLRDAFGNANIERFQALYAEIPLGADHYAASQR